MEEENDDKYKMDFNDVNENLLNDEKKPFLKKKIIKIFILIIIIIINVIALLAIFRSFILNGKNGNEEKEKKECQSGYFYPDDKLENQECQKCSISNCNICKGNKINNTCHSCDKNYLPFIENNIIESCELISELDDCLTRDNQTNKCLVCASNYYLVNGKCKPYSFFIINKNDKNDEEINMINIQYLPYIKEMYINNINILINSFNKFSSI